MIHLEFAKSSARVLSCLGLLATAGCNSTDPYQRAGLWRPNQTNTINLARMVAVPGDLAFGAGDGTGDGQQAAAALDRLRDDKVKPLPNSGVAKFSATPSGTPAGSP